MEKKSSTINIQLTKTQLITIQGSLMGSRDSTSNDDLKRSFVKLLGTLGKAKEIGIKKHLKHCLKIQKQYNDCQNVLSFLKSKAEH